MDKTILFLFDFMDKQATAYFFARELAKRLECNLKIVVSFTSPKEHNHFSLVRPNRLKQLKKSIHQYFLKQNGIYMGNFCQWKNTNNENLSIKLQEGKIANTLLCELQRNNYYMLLLTHDIYTRNLDNPAIIEALFNSNTKLWVMPLQTDNYFAHSTFQKEFLKDTKQFIYAEMVKNTKFHQMPDDIISLKNGIN